MASLFAEWLKDFSTKVLSRICVLPILVACEANQRSPADIYSQSIADMGSNPQHAS
jgi:hypothetical protein